MMKTSASVILGSSKSSTGTRPPHHSAARTDVVLLIRCTVRPEGRLGAPGLGGEMPELFEHPPGRFSCRMDSSFASAKIAFPNILRLCLSQTPSLVAEGEHTDPYDDHGEGKELAHGERGKDKTNVSIRFANKLDQHPA
jgi:hypothetical protein